MKKHRCIDCHFLAISDPPCREIKKKDRDELRTGRVPGITPDLEYRCERGKWGPLRSTRIQDELKTTILATRECRLYADYVPGESFAAMRAQHEAITSKWAFGIAIGSLVVALAAFIVSIFTRCINN